MPRNGSSSGCCCSRRAGLFEPYRGDPVFAGQLDYLISDMNTHPVHGLRYLCAVLSKAVAREGRDPRRHCRRQRKRKWRTCYGPWGICGIFADRGRRYRGFGPAGSVGADAAVLAEAVARSAAAPPPPRGGRRGRARGGLRAKRSGYRHPVVIGIELLSSGSKSAFSKSVSGWSSPSP